MLDSSSLPLSEEKGRGEKNAKCIHEFVWIIKNSCSNYQIYLSKLLNIFAIYNVSVLIITSPRRVQKYLVARSWYFCICQNCQMYLFKCQNIFVWIAKCICPHHRQPKKSGKVLGRQELILLSWEDHGTKVTQLLYNNHLFVTFFKLFFS